MQLAAQEKHPDRQPVDRGAVLPPVATPGAPPQGAPARPLDAERAFCASRRRRRTSRTSPWAASAPMLDDQRLEADQKREVGRLVICSGRGLLRHRRARGVRSDRGRGRGPASSSCTRSRSPPTTSCSRATRASPRSYGHRRSRRTWARGRAIRHRLEEGLPAEFDLRYVGRSVAREPERGLPDGARARTGPASPARRSARSRRTVRAAAPSRRPASSSPLPASPSPCGCGCARSPGR